MVVLAVSGESGGGIVLRSVCLQWRGSEDLGRLWQRVGVVVQE